MTKGFCMKDKLTDYGGVERKKAQNNQKGLLYPNDHASRFPLLQSSKISCS